MHTARATLVRRGLWLNVGTIAYNSLEAIISLVAGVMAGSVALVGFGVDSVIEVTASGAAHWRLRADWDAARRERVERATLRVIGATFLGLAAYVASDAVVALVHGERPDESPVGIVIAALSLVVMPLLARAKRRVALAMGSGALVAEARQTSLCAYLSAILRARTQRTARMVVGRSGRCTRNGADHREGRRRRIAWARDLLRRLRGDGASGVITRAGCADTPGDATTAG